MNLSCRSISGRILLLFSGLVVVQQTHAHADYLQCYIDLEDEEEIVMRKPILKLEDQSLEEQKVVIEVQPILAPKKAPWQNSTVQHYEHLFPPSDSTAPTNLRVRLRLPQSLQQPKKSFQYVLQAKGKGVSFVGPPRTVMCSGKRVSWNKHEGHVVLQIEDASEGTVQDDIELLAVWARGYEAVKLTQKLIVKRGVPKPAGEGGGEL